MERHKKIFRLLVVDDQEDQSLITQRAFKEVLPSAEIRLETNDESTIQYLTHCITQEWDFPTLILLDLYMPERDNGWRVLNTIRSLPAPLNQVPVVMVSGSDQEEDIQEAYQQGCTSYMVKPLTFPDWLHYFQAIKAFWLDTATLPQMPYLM